MRNGKKCTQGNGAQCLEKDAGDFTVDEFAGEAVSDAADDNQRITPAG